MAQNLFLRLRRTFLELQRPTLMVDAMSEPVYLLILPIFLTLAAFSLRQRSPLYWWVLFLVIISSGSIWIIHSAKGSPTSQDLAGPLILLGVPLLFFFSSLYLPVFRGRPWLTLVLCPLFYWLGVLVSVSIGVTSGLLKP